MSNCPRCQIVPSPCTPKKMRRSSFKQFSMLFHHGMLITMLKQAVCGEVEKSQKYKIFVEKWKWKSRPPGIFPPTWRSSAPLSAASQFWPTDEKLRNENSVQGSGLELFVLNVLYCLIVSSSPLFIGPESDHCLALSLTRQLSCVLEAWLIWLQLIGEDDSLRVFCFCC